MARRVARDFDVVSDAILGRRDAVVFPLEERLLEIPAGPPGEDASNLEVFAQDVAHHVLRVDAFGWTFVVGAAGGVDVVIAGIPAQLRRIDPPLEAEGQGLRTAVLNSEGLGSFSIFRPPGVLDGVSP